MRSQCARAVSPDTKLALRRSPASDGFQERDSQDLELVETELLVTVGVHLGVDHGGS